MPVEPPSDNGSAAGSGIQFHCPAVSVPDVTTDPDTSCGVPGLSVAFGQSHSAHFTGAVEGKARCGEAGIEGVSVRVAEP